MADTINWNDPRSWSIPPTQEQQTGHGQGRMLYMGATGHYSGANTVSGSAPYGSYLTRQNAERIRSETGSYPKGATIIELDGTNSKPGTVAPVPNRTWSQFFSGVGSSDASREQQLWKQAQGVPVTPPQPTLPQQLQQRTDATNAAVADPRAAMQHGGLLPGNFQIPQYRPSYQPAKQPEPSYVAPRQSYDRPYELGSPITREREMAVNEWQSGPVYRLPTSIDDEVPFRSLPYRMGHETGFAMGYPQQRYEPPSGEDYRPRAADELRRELRDPQYQSRYNFQGMMDEREAQKMVQEADAEATRAQQTPQQEPQAGQPGTNTQSQSGAGQSGSNGHWTGAVQSIGYGHVIAQHNNGQWFLDYDTNSPWDLS